MKTKTKALTDKDILSIVKAEREAAEGDNDGLSEARERALDYYFAKTDDGHYRRDLPPEEGQSAAVSTDVSDAIETVLPDLMEIFTAGDDVVAFTPESEEDEPQAEQETDYVNYVFYRENKGWLTLYNNFKDALTSKTGVFKWWWEETEEWDEFVFEDKSEDEWKIIRSEINKGNIELADIENLDEVKPNEDGLYTCRVRKRIKKGGARVATIAPEDFMADRNAAMLCDAVWAGNKSRERVFSLIERGYDEEKIAMLRDFDSPDENERERRDPVSEGLEDANTVHGHKLLRRVEIREYHIWLDVDGDGKVECWKIITGNDDAILLDKEKIGGIQYALNCPYPVTHQLYGRSLADLMMEVQKIKTALMRLMLNAFYFGVNPRPEVDMSKATEFTLSDLMGKNNKPGRPIRTKGEGAVNWRVPPIVGDAVLPVLEYMSTVGEQRAGVVRNAQGLNPDTLHDTAKGAMELMTAAQRRVRMIARIFAETGVHDLFIGLHDLIVRHGRKKETVRLRNEWVEVDPNKWNRRKDLSIDVGLGSNTKSMELQFWTMVIEMQAQAAQYGLADPVNFYNAAKKLLQAGNQKNPELYFKNPQKEGFEQPEAQQSPEAIKAQGELQIKQQQAQQDMQIKQQQFQFETQLALYKSQVEMGLAEQAAATEARINEMMAERKMALEEYKAANEQQTKTMTAAISAKAAMKKAESSVTNVRMGGKVG